ASLLMYAVTCCGYSRSVRRQDLTGQTFLFPSAECTSSADFVQRSELPLSRSHFARVNLRNHARVSSASPDRSTTAACAHHGVPGSQWCLRTERSGRYAAV